MGHNLSFPKSRENNDSAHNSQVFINTEDPVCEHTDTRVRTMKRLCFPSLCHTDCLPSSASEDFLTISTQ